jgi:hypothetical protein
MIFLPRRHIQQWQDGVYDSLKLGKIRKILVEKKSSVELHHLFPFINLSINYRGRDMLYNKTQVNDIEMNQNSIV